MYAPWALLDVYTPRAIYKLVSLSPSDRHKHLHNARAT
jgi:hypothetical protein